MYSVAGSLKPGSGGRPYADEAVESSRVWPWSLVLPSQGKNAVEDAKLEGIQANRGLSAPAFQSNIRKM